VFVHGRHPAHKETILLYAGKKIQYHLAVLAAFATLLVYLPALHNEFAELDDAVYVLNNPFIRSFDSTLFRWAFFHFYAANWHPLAWLSHALDYALWGLKPLGHHLTNIILHAVNTALVVVFAAKLLETARKRSALHTPASFLNDRTIRITAGVTGLLFGLHPVHVESVVWVAERKDLLCAVFFLLSLMAYVKYADSQESAKNTREKSGRKKFLTNKHYLLTLCFFILALMSKPMAVTLPVVLLLLDWHPLNRVQSFKNLRAAIVEKAPFLALSILSSIVTMSAQQTGGAMKMMELVPLSTRALVAVQALDTYLGKMLLPLHLAPFYPYPKDASLYSFEYASAIIMMVGITAACMVVARRRKVWLSAWGYYVITLVPVLGLIQVGEQSMADRYTYLPSLEPFFIAGLGTAWTARKTRCVIRGETLSLFPAVILILSTAVLLSYSTLRQVGLWKNGITLWSSVIEREPTRAPFAYRFRGQAFEKAGQFDSAAADYRKAIALNPRFIETYNDLGMLYGRARLYEQAIEVFSRSISLDPGRASSYSNRGRTYFHLGRYDEALDDLNRAIALDGNFDVAYVNRGELYYRTGKTALANADLRKACDLGNAIGCKALQQLMEESPPKKQRDASGI
jgi:tetratricopeptide (TPR) repeat protein